MSKHAVERPRHFIEVERLDEMTRVPDLPSRAAAHEAPQLLLDGPFSPLGLLLHRAERSEVAVRLDDLDDRGDTESADQLVLEIRVAHVEPESFHVGSTELGAEAGPLESASEVDLLSGVTESRQLDVEPPRPEALQKPPDGLCATDGHDGHSFRGESPAAPLGERFDSTLVADPFDEHDGTHPHSLPRLTVLFRQGDTPTVRDGKGSETLAALLVGWGVNVVALLVVDAIFDGVAIGVWGGVLVGAAVFGIANAIVKPVVALLTLPLILLSLGLAYFAINVLMLALAEWVAPDFTIDGLWTYVGATIVIWLVNWILNSMLGSLRRDPRRATA